MPWRIEKKFTFEASHVLPHHAGKCSRLHGHSWIGWLICEGDQLKEAGSSKGMLVDFGDLKEVVQPIVENYLDHFHLNDSLKMENPTCETIARWIYDQMKPKVPLLSSVLIEETCTARCEYRQ